MTFSFCHLSNLMIVVVSLHLNMEGKSLLDWLFHRTSFRSIFYRYSGFYAFSFICMWAISTVFRNVYGKISNADASGRQSTIFMRSSFISVIFIPWKSDLFIYLLNILIPELVYTIVVTIFLYFIILKLTRNLKQ